MIRRLVAFVAFALLLWVQAVPAGAQQPARIAFVVGNAEYGQAPLPTALNDAGLVAEAFGVREKGMDDMDSAKAAIAAIRRFTKKIGHPQKLSEMKVKEDDIAKAAELLKVPANKLARLIHRIPKLQILIKQLGEPEKPA